jgi:hypothetical protein
MSRPNPRELRNVIDEFANALQAAVGLIALIRLQTQTTMADVVKVEAAIGRAASALRRLQPAARRDR